MKTSNKDCFCVAALKTTGTPIRCCRSGVLRFARRSIAFPTRGLFGESHEGHKTKNPRGHVRERSSHSRRDFVTKRKRILPLRSYYDYHKKNSLSIPRPLPYTRGRREEHFGHGVNLSKSGEAPVFRLSYNISTVVVESTHSTSLGTERDTFARLHRVRVPPLSKNTQSTFLESWSAAGSALIVSWRSIFRSRSIRGGWL